MGALGQNMVAEIAETPEVFARILWHYSDIEHIAREIATRKPHTILFAGRGTSDHACIYGKYLAEIKLGKPAGLISPSAMTIYDAEPNYAGVLLIVVSQSGGSPDLVTSAQMARAGGATVLAITNTPTSPLAQASEFNLNVHAGKENAVAATKSYSAQLLTLSLFFSAWQGLGAKAASRLPDVAARIAQASAAYEEVATALTGIDRLIITGRGYAYPTALEAALKIMETVYIDAHAFSAADLLHGPMAMVSKNVPVLAVAPDGIGLNATKPALERLAQTTDELFVLGSSSVSGIGRHHVDVTHDLGEELSPMLDIIALQNIIVRMAIAAGNDPDNPRGLKKVTETI